jgi:hypothetical protein
MLHLARSAPTPALAIAIGAALLLPLDLGAQAPTADPEDVVSIDAIITAVYDVISGDAGEARDWDRFHSLFADGATLSAIQRRPDGTIGRVIMTPGSYVERSGSVLERNGFVEAEIGRTTEEFGLLAHAFSSYASFRSRADTEPFARGINSFQLLNDGERWWIVSIYWLQEAPEWPIPDRYIGVGR